MWDKVKKVAGYIWSSPVTAVGLVYSGLFHAAGWYEWFGVREDGLVWRVGSGAPSWLRNLWKSWSGHAVGNVVVLNTDPEVNPKILQHELVHVRQCMRLGIFQPIVYGINLVAIKIGCETSSPYYSNPFEIDARRAVGQVVDVESALKRILSKSVEKTS